MSDTAANPVEAVPGPAIVDRDLQSLLALQAALGARESFTCLWVGSPVAAAEHALGADTRCRELIAVPDPRGAHDRDGPPPDLCVIAASGDQGLALDAARLARRALAGRGLIVFYDRAGIEAAITRFLGELPGYRAYPLAHGLLVVELGVPSLLGDPRVSAQVPRPVWLLLDRLGAVPLALRLAPLARALESSLWRAVLTATGPRAVAAPSTREGRAASTSPFAVHTFVRDPTLYERMRGSFIAAGFSAEALVALSGSEDDPYAAITRFGLDPPARYPVLCHQDVIADQGAGASELLAVLQELDAIDPSWVVAGNAGVTRGGHRVRRLVDPVSSSNAERLPVAVVSLDENFLVFNGSAGARCSPALSGFHFYGTDVCLNALSSGGSAYVVDFPLTHLSSGRRDDAYRRARQRFIDVWSQRCAFRYVVTTTGTVFLSRYGALRRVFGSRVALAYADRANRNGKVPAAGVTRRPLRH